MADIEISFESRLPTDRLGLGVHDYRAFVDSVRNVVQPAGISTAEVRLQKDDIRLCQFGNGSDAKRRELGGRLGANTVDFFNW